MHQRINVLLDAAGEMRDEPQQHHFRIGQIRVLRAHRIDSRLIVVEWDHVGVDSYFGNYFCMSPATCPSSDLPIVRAPWLGDLLGSRPCCLNRSLTFVRVSPCQ